MDSIQFQFKGWAELDTSELYQFLQLRSEVFVVEQECAYQDLDGEDAGSIHVLAKSSDAKALIAYSRIYRTHIDDKAYGAIGRVCTAHKFRGQGVSRQMMTLSIEHIEKKLKLPVTVSAQAYLTGFYESLGFEAILEPYLEDGIPHVRMIRG